MPVSVSVSRAESQHVVAGYSDGTIRVFSISQTEMELKMHPHSVAVTAVGYSTDGKSVGQLLRENVEPTLRGRPQL